MSEALGIHRSSCHSLQTIVANGSGSFQSCFHVTRFQNIPLLG